MLLVCCNVTDNNQSNRHFYTIYVAHNLHFIVYACMFDGQYQVALDASKKLVGVLTEDTLEYSCLGPFCGKHEKDYSF